MGRIDVAGKIVSRLLRCPEDLQGSASGSRWGGKLIGGELIAPPVGFCQTVKKSQISALSNTFATGRQFPAKILNVTSEVVTHGNFLASVFRYQLACVLFSSYFFFGNAAIPSLPISLLLAARSNGRIYCRDGSHAGSIAQLRALGRGAGQGHADCLAPLGSTKQGGGHGGDISTTQKCLLWDQKKNGFALAKSVHVVAPTPNCGNKHNGGMRSQVTPSPPNVTK